MVTVDFNKLRLKPKSLILDACCGNGRHLRALAKLPDLKDALTALKNMPDAVSDDYLVSRADIKNLPFASASFDCVICSEVLEHIPEHESALKELVRIIKPQGDLVISVLRYFSERICWLISTAYYSEEGGHIRIYKKKKLQKMLANQGIKCWKIKYKHALHAPYW